jgi:LPXTG-motif cell wall-anchored protein
MTSAQEAGQIPLIPIAGIVILIAIIAAVLVIRRRR